MKYYLFALLILGISCVFQGIDVSVWQNYINWPKSQNKSVLQPGLEIRSPTDPPQQEVGKGQQLGVPLWKHLLAPPCTPAPTEC